MRSVCIGRIVDDEWTCRRIGKEKHRGRKVWNGRAIIKEKMQGQKWNVECMSESSVKAFEG